MGGLLFSVVWGILPCVDALIGGVLPIVELVQFVDMVLIVSSLFVIAVVTILSAEVSLNLIRYQ